MDYQPMMMIIEMPPAHEQTTADRTNDHKKAPQTLETKTNMGLG